MNKEKIDKLLEKYYSGDSSLEEEAALKNAIENDSESFMEEQLAFDLYENEAFVPADLEEQLFAGIQQHENKTRLLKSRWVKYSSLAAAIGLVASIFWFSAQSYKKQKMTDEQRFAIMEQALMEVSYGLQPQEEQDLLVLFQDDNLEIVVD